MAPFTGGTISSDSNRQVWLQRQQMWQVSRKAQSIEDPYKKSSDAGNWIV